MMKVKTQQIHFRGEESVPRAGEGSAVQLKDGRILFIFTRFTGGVADHDKADLFGGILDPENGWLREERVFFPSLDALNQMSISLERLADGSIGMVYLKKSAPCRGIVLFSRSKDDGRTWSVPVDCGSCFPECTYWVVNNDRLRQSSTGRLLIPACLYFDEFGGRRPSELGVLYSDDYGTTWKLSSTVRIQDENVCPPHSLASGAEEEWERSFRSFYREQESGVEELSDGRLLLYCRTMLGYMYQAYSADGGESWSSLLPAKDIVSPCGPQSIRRIPGTGRLLCIYNDRRHVAYGDREKFWDWRTPLSAAVSDDCGKSWRKLGDIENEDHNYCYVSILFAGENVILTDYESRNNSPTDRYNLVFAKMQVVPLAECLK